MINAGCLWHSSLAVRQMCATAWCSTSTVIAMVMGTLTMVALMMVLMILTITQPDQRGVPGIPPHDCNKDNDDYCDFNHDDNIDYQPAGPTCTTWCST